MDRRQAGPIRAPPGSPSRSHPDPMRSAMDLATALHTTPTVDRQALLATLGSALHPLPYVQAMWEGGAAALGRVDRWSDVDLQVATDDDQVDQVFPVVEA